MQVATIIEMALTVVGTLGGWETIKYFLNRNTNRRIAEAEADSADFHVLRESVEFFQVQMRQKEERFAEQTDRLREVQRQLFDEREKRHTAELELMAKRCNDILCPFREPPTAHTPHKPGLTKEEYHEQKAEQNGES